MLAKIKNIFLQRSDVTMDIEAPATINLKRAMLDFTLHFDASHDWVLDSVSIRLVEKYSRGWGESRKVDEYTLYENIEELDMLISAEEVHASRLRIDVDYKKSPVERIGKSRILRPLSKLAMLSKRVKSEFRLEISAKIKGVKINPIAVHHFKKSVNW